MEIGIDTMSIPHAKRSSGFPIDSVHVPDMYNLVCDGEECINNIDICSYLLSQGENILVKLLALSIL